jgi:hypothetical protein
LYPGLIRLQVFGARTPRSKRSVKHCRRRLILSGASDCKSDKVVLRITDSDRYWQAYQSTAYPFYPVLVDVEGFGLSVFEFLNTRASQNATEPNPSWLALLFAVLACGAQFTHDPVQERDLRSKVFSMLCARHPCLTL